jgi:hypothetical protein
VVVAVVLTLAVGLMVGLAAAVEGIQAILPCPQQMAHPIQAEVVAVLGQSQSMAAQVSY